MAEPQQVPLESLGVQELSELRQQLEAQVQDLMQGLMALQQSAAKFAAAGQSVEYLAEQKQGGQGRSVVLQGSGDHWPRWCRAWGWAGPRRTSRLSTSAAQQQLLPPWHKNVLH